MEIYFVWSAASVSTVRQDGVVFCDIEFDQAPHGGDTVQVVEEEPAVFGLQPKSLDQ